MKKTPLVRGLVTLAIAVIISILLFWKGCRHEVSTTSLLTPTNQQRSTDPNPLVVVQTKSHSNGQQKNEVAVPLRPELLPKTVSLVRCYYSQGIVGPGNQLVLNINGSGFTQNFLKSLEVTFDNALDIGPLEMVTSNHIRGTVTVHSDAITAYVYPTLRIAKQPVFIASNPFGVIRPGEVLAILIQDVTRDGKSGTIKVLTNLDESQAKTFTLKPSALGLSVSLRRWELPYTAEGTVEIVSKAAVGSYGLIAYLNEKEIFRNDGLFHLVQPEKGMKGVIRDISLENRFYGQNDLVTFLLKGSDLVHQDVNKLTIKVPSISIRSTQIQFLSKTEVRATFQLPNNTPTGTYTIQLINASGEIIFGKNDSFAVVAENWLYEIRLAQPAAPGDTVSLQLVGKDFTDDFIKKLKLEIEDADIQIAPLQKQSSSLLQTTLKIGASVQPGDYVVQTKVDGKKVGVATGNIIHITPVLK